jgi:hypothetical protein
VAAGTPTSSSSSSSSRSKTLIITGALVVALSLVAAVFISNQRERRTQLAIRKQTTAIMLDLTREMDRAAVAMIAFNSDGGLDLSGLDEPAALDRRIALATAGESAAQRVLERGDAAPAQLESALRGYAADPVAAAKQQLPQKLDWPQGQAIFRTHARAYAAARTHLEFLRTHHGHWRVDPVGLRVNWDSQQLQAQAERLQADVTSAAAAQGKLWSASQPATTKTTTTPSS